MTTSLPSCSSASFAATAEPRASPSGFSCVVTRNRSLPRIASATACRSVFVSVWGELIDELGKPHSPLYRRIVLKPQLGSSLQVQLPVHPALEHAVGRLQTGERRVPPPLVTEDADIHDGVAQVGTRLDARDGHEPDPRVLERADFLGEHLLERLVDSPHTLTHPASRPPAPSG